jgi:hypothetical protein
MRWIEENPEDTYGDNRNSDDDPHEQGQNRNHTDTLTMERPTLEGNVYPNTMTMERPVVEVPYTPTIAAHEWRPQRASDMEGQVGRFYEAEAQQMRQNAGSSLELDAFEDQILNLSRDQRQSFLGATDPLTEHAIRENIGQAIESTASFLAPNNSRRMPENAQLLSIPLNEFNPATEESTKCTKVELETLFGVTQHGEPQVVRVGDQSMFMLTEPTMLPGVALSFVWRPDADGSQTHFEVWLEREQPQLQQMAA